jgi:hypothetical protein
MTRVFNLLLLAAAVAALIVGGYWIGRAILQTGNDNSNRASQQTRATQTAPIRTPTRTEPDRLREPWVRAVLLAAGAIVVVSVVLPPLGRLARRRHRRESWHA